MKPLLVIGMVVALAPALGAQDGLRSASLPERPIATQAPGPEDLFRASPNTYRPHTDRDWSSVRRTPVLSNGSSFWPYLDVPSPEPLRAVEPPATRVVKRGPAVVREAPDHPYAPPPVVRPTPVAPKTIYVIPRCYAGDKPPDASSRCDLTKLRTIR